MIAAIYIWISVLITYVSNNKEIYYCAILNLVQTLDKFLSFVHLKGHSNMLSISFVKEAALE